MTTAALRAAWQKKFGHSAPDLRRQLLVAILAYEYQVDLHGELSERARKLINRLNGPNPSQSLHLPPGTRLMREWQGRHHAVLVSEDGFERDARLYPSLSEVARAITGTRWSGPRFFGLARGRKNSP